MSTNNRTEKFLVATTDSLAGYQILKYHGMVSTGVVAGAGWVTEFFAGFTDTFGGRSQSLEKHLSELHTQALDQLERKARRVGANALIGVKIDVDELSGKGTFMLMVSAVGTPVTVVPEDGARTEGIQSDDGIGYERLMSKIYEKKLFSERCVSTGAGDTARIFGELIESRFLLPLDSLVRFVDLLRDDLNSCDFLSEYISMYDEQEFTETVNQYALTGEPSERVLAQAYEKFAKPDYAAILQILKRGNVRYWAKAISVVLQKPKPKYYPADLIAIKQIIEEIPKITAASAEISVSRFGGESWICGGCAKKNPTTITHCNCGCGMSGLQFDDERRLLKVREHLSEIHDMLQQISAGE